MDNKVAAEQGGTRGNDTGTSDIQMNSPASLNDNASTPHNIVHRVKQKYLLSFIVRQMTHCPDTKCNNSRVLWNVIKHYREAHPSVPKFILELNKHYKIRIELRQLEYGKNKSLALLSFPLTTGREPRNDHSTMPVVVLAAKIHPSGNIKYVKTHTKRSNSGKIMNDGDMLMIWVSGHIRALRSVLTLQAAMETKRYVYNGCIHHLADNNHQLHMVFSRGNCLLVPAKCIKEMTNNGTVPLDLHLSIYVDEKDL